MFSHVYGRIHILKNHPAELLCVGAIKLWKITLFPSIQGRLRLVYSFAKKYMKVINGFDMTLVHLRIVRAKNPIMLPPLNALPNVGRSVGYTVSPQ